MSGRARSALLALLLTVACHRAEPPGAVPTGRSPLPASAELHAATPSPAAEPAPAPVASAAPSSAATNSAPQPSASPSAAPVSAASDADPLLLDDQGQPLPQTEQRPTTTSASFQRRIRAVAEAILSGKAEDARGAFFPLVAYQAVKDVAKPERDYRFRLLAHFARDVKDYHEGLGRDAGAATFLGIDVQEPAAKWMKPGSEGNRLGYYRVLRSQLRFRLADGKERKLELLSLISWRGEWYVVHLHGFE